MFLYTLSESYINNVKGTVTWLIMAQVIKPEHAIVTFRKNKKKGKCNWWRAEKSARGLQLRIIREKF